ncbi:MAG: NAD-dependent epimerase/dehydratase family protein [Bacteroidota bacterium]
MKVFLTGATGFVGSYVSKALLDAGHSIVCLIREGSEEKLDIRGREGVDVIVGSVTSGGPIYDQIEDCDAAIHLVGIIEEHPARGVTFENVHVEGTRFVVEQAKKAGIERFVHMSANGAKPQGKSEYQTTKWEAEHLVKNAGFAHWTIFRPSVIFGDPGEGRPEFVSQLAKTLVEPFPVLPVFGNGKYELQPIHITTLADAFVQALSLPAAHGQIFFAGNRERHTYVDVLDIITQALGLPEKSKIHTPLWLVRPAIETAGRVGLLPITPDQFYMLIEGNTGNPDPFFATFDVTEVLFWHQSLNYLK